MATELEGNEQLQRFIRLLADLNHETVEMIRSGNMEFSKAKKSIEEDLHQRNMPEIEYFFEHFIESFNLTLDDLESV